METTTQRSHVDFAQSSAISFDGVSKRFRRADGSELIAVQDVSLAIPPGSTGARLAFGFGWRVSLVAETLGAASSVGYRLKQASDLIQTDSVLAWTLAQIAMMLLIEIALLQRLERHLFRWRLDTRG